MEYLKKLQSIHAPAGEEQALSTELLNYIAQNK
ncbi:MAG: hypothetical protein ACI8ZO_001439, partial [Flavobacteriales bacterium]